MSAATNVFVTLAIAKPVSSVTGRAGAYSALPAVPIQIDPSGSMTATERPATGPFLTVLSRIFWSLPLSRRSKVSGVGSGTKAGSANAGAVGNAISVSPIAVALAWRGRR